MHVDPHPLLELRWFEAAWPQPLRATTPAEDLDPSEPSPFPPLDADAKDLVRALLRVGGFKPSGRSKPCNEYIRAAVDKGAFPRINPVVDLTNLAVLHGGLPVSTVDPDRLSAPLRVGLAPERASYVFNASGQVIDVSGLLCLFDAHGPCANAVKDAQRAKTTPDTRRTLTLVWGTTALSGRAQRVVDWLAARSAAWGAQIGSPNAEG